mmetsp:Transcript_22763/g.42760  ORF Transcript_22763/g.42760 Transcript_22763/m.42760 type:complete len:481 (-) Transcript_22763:321-1763(-)
MAGNTENKGRKRKRKKENKANGCTPPEKAKKASKAEVMASQPSKLPKVVNPVIGPKFDEKDLHCAVCTDFPEKEIFQCENGHLMCDHCHKRVIQGANPFCPICRVRLSRDRKCRNRFAEVVLSSIMVPCKNPGCKQTVQYGMLKEHASEKCGFRQVCCKYHLLGCEWEGIYNHLDEHHKRCKLKKASTKKILKNVILRNSQEAQKHRQAKAGLMAQKAVCDLMSSYCGDICVRDVVIEKDEICDEMCCKTFAAFGMAWEMVLVPPPQPPARTVGYEPVRNYSFRNLPQRRDDGLGAYQPLNDSKGENVSSLGNNHSSSNAAAGAAPAGAVATAGATGSDGKSEEKSKGFKVGVKLRAVSTLKRKVRLRFFVLKGPGLDMELQPTIHRVTLKRNRTKESEVCYLGFRNEDAPLVHELDSIHLRVGLVDMRRRMAPGFSTLNSRGTHHDDSGVSDTEVSSSTDFDDDTDYSEGDTWADDYLY